jgi:thymidylate synthase
MSKRPSSIKPILVEDRNLSHAWARAFLHVIEHPGKEISPLIISVTGFDDDGVAVEDETIRIALDRALSIKGKRSIEDVAFTIFPQRLWKMAQGNRKRLFDMYRDAFPRYQAMNKSANRRGLYFQRLTTQGPEQCQGNQLEWILSQFGGRHGVRDSMFQASIFDPARDHVSDAQLQFPCLQHVSFQPTEEGLVINAFYATQKLFSKAYGNYLGLAQLGSFMAHEMKKKLVRMNVFVGVEKFDEYAKSEAVFRPLIEAARACLVNDVAITSRALAESEEVV